MPFLKTIFKKSSRMIQEAGLLSSGSFVFYQPFFLPALIFFPLTGCHHIFSQLPTTSYSATTDLNTDLALSVPLRQEREIPYPQLPPTMLQGRILPVSSVFQLPEYALLFLPDSYTFRFSADQCPDWKTLLLAQRDGEPWHIDPSCQYRLGLSDKLYLQHLNVLWLGTSLILGYNWYCDAGSKEVKIGSHSFSHKLAAVAFSSHATPCISMCASCGLSWWSAIMSVTWGVH